MDGPATCCRCPRRIRRTRRRMTSSGFLSSCCRRFSTSRSEGDIVGHSLAEVTAVVPARNAELMLPRCLEALRQSGVAEIIVVDGCSTDRTVALALAAGARVLSDEGRGLPWARTLGVRSSSTRWVLLVDSDVVFGPTGVADLLTELVEGGHDALQAGLESVGGPGYWGQALAH